MTSPTNSGFLKPFAAALLFAASLSFASSPDWVSNRGVSAEHPRQTWLVGFGLSQNASLEQARQAALDNARRHVSEQLSVEVNGLTRMLTEEIDEDFHQYFSSVSQSRTSLEIEGLLTEEYFDKKEGVYYALTFAEKAVTAKLYAEKISQAREQLVQSLAAAEAAETSRQPTAAMKRYLECRSQVDKLIRFKMIELVVSGAAAESADDAAIIEKVWQGIEQLDRRPIESLEDAAWRISAAFTSLRTGSRRILLLPFTCQNTGLGSPMSRYLHAALASQLRAAGWQMVESAEAGRYDRLLAGAYWERGDGVRLFCRMQDAHGDSAATSLEIEIPRAVIDAAGLSLKPQNFEAAMIDQAVFQQGELVGGGLLLDVWTNKEHESNIFVEGDTMRVFVRVNIPCYLRLIYHLADGKRCALLDSYYIDASKVNRIIELPDQFQAIAPFGAEALQCFASTKPFEPLKVRSEGDYDFLAEDLQTFVGKARGMGKISISDRPAMQAEKRKVITTIAEEGR